MPLVPGNVELQVGKLSKPEHRALRALAKGEADAHEQVIALEVITKKLSRAFDLSYVPGDPNASAFLAGRGFVGQQIVKYVNLPVKE